MDTIISRSPEETFGWGMALGRRAEKGWVIGLSGELGAGKTMLVKGVARGLGISEPVRSPTFALVHEYRGGRLPLFHLDLYRLETPELVMQAGLEEYFAPEGLTLVEWAERCPDAYLTGASRIRIDIMGSNERRILYEDAVGA